MPRHAFAAKTAHRAGAWRLSGTHTLSNQTETVRPLNHQSALQIQLQVLHALILRDIRTRFGRTMWGYAIVVLWPVAHLLMVVVIMTVRHLPPAFGESTTLFVYTGLMPVIVFIYLSRKIMEGVAGGKPLISFPDVKVLDLCLSRAIVEVLNACMSCTIIMFILFCIGVDPIPQDEFLAVRAMLVSIFFSFGIGVLLSNIAYVYPMFMMGFALLVIIVYAASGVYFIPEGMPSQIYNIMIWNPITHMIMLFRQAYYPEYVNEGSAAYVIYVAGAMTLIGLLVERFFTRHQ